MGLKNYTVDAYREGFQGAVAHIKRDMLTEPPVNVGEWQGKRGGQDPRFITHELQDVSIQFPLPTTQAELADKVQPQLPWVEDHFQERVSREPLNPPPSASQWLRPGVVDEHLTVEEEGVKKYTHTYPERFWPKQAAGGYKNARMEPTGLPNAGIRYLYGDLDDVVNLLADHPGTRQAYLPVFFPEDTGAVHRGRVPCTLGYHFLLRGGKLHCTYYIRSCDLIRHFRDDVYLAGRLCQWVLQELVPRTGDDDRRDVRADHAWAKVEVGNLTMHIVSLHCFQPDLKKLAKEMET